MKGLYYHLAGLFFVTLKKCIYRNKYVIELKRKFEMEQKNWFYKILYPVHDGVKMFMSNPQLTTGNLAITGITMGLNIANNFVCQAEEIDKTKKKPH